MLAEPIHDVIFSESVTIKRVLILSDNDGLSKAVELNLRATSLPAGVELETIRCVPSTDEGIKTQINHADLHLIVVALSSVSSAPALALAKNSLLHRVGYTPMLIISQTTTEFNAQEHTSHMKYPFDIDQLQNAIKDMLRTPMEG